MNSEVVIFYLWIGTGFLSVFWLMLIKRDFTSWFWRLFLGAIFAPIFFFGLIAELRGWRKNVEI